MDTETGKLPEQILMPPGTAVSGLESDGNDQFFCGGRGKPRVIRRSQRTTAANEALANRRWFPANQAGVSGPIGIVSGMARMPARNVAGG